MEPIKNPHNGRPHGEFTWCASCTQTHRTERWVERGWYCPAGCGSTAIDALPWEFVREENAAYPARPQEGHHYLRHARPACPDPA